jgi:O-antigen/teichoic acid export membrane protein
LTTITGIFYLAWQETAIKEYNSDNRDIFFSNIFEKYSRLLYGLTLCAIPATQIVISVFVGDEYKNAWMYTGFLYLGAVFSALSSFLGLGYQISKETKRSMSTTIFAAAINILVNILLIEKIGLQAASFSTFISYLFLFLVRIRHCRRYFELKVNWTFFWLMLLATLIMIYVVWAFDNLLVSLLLCLFAFIFFLMINKYILNLFFGRFKR